MGLDDLSESLNKERSDKTADYVESKFREYESSLRSQPETIDSIFDKAKGWFFSNARGKILLLDGIALAKAEGPKMLLEYEFRFVADKSSEIKTTSLSRFKGLVHIIQQLKNTDGVRPRLKNLYDAYAHQQDISVEDSELFLPFIQYFSKEYARFKKFCESKVGPFSYDSAVTREQIREFKNRADSHFYDLAQKQLFLLSANLENRKMNKRSPELERVLQGLQRLNEGLYADRMSISPAARYDLDKYHLKNLTKEFNALGGLTDTLTPAQAKKTFQRPFDSISPVQSKAPAWAQPSKRVLKHAKLSSPKKTESSLPSLCATLGSTASRLLMNTINCCITGPNGRSKEASILYLLDPAVHLWDIHQGKLKDFSIISPIPQNGFDSCTDGLVICVEAKGKHASNSDLEDYLVLEGFPMNSDFYSTISNITYSRATSGFALNMSDRSSLAKMAYVLGLKTAQLTGIQKMFINADHTGRQRSVEDVVLEAAQAKKPGKGIWSFKNDKFSLKGDPQNGGPLAAVSFGGAEFKYTHFMQKQPLDVEIVNLLRNDPLWNGEGYFDTWYRWNKFICEVNEQQLDELCKLHPYARDVWLRAKKQKDAHLPLESFWNLGVGYCRGIEVDVERECERLKI